MKERVKTSKSLLRREKILSLLNESDDISTTALATHFNVSNCTIRRDLNALADQNKIRRHHGGAKNIDSHLQARKRTYRNKINLVKQVLPSVFEGCHIYIDSPSLAETLVGLLPDFGINILTNDLNVHHQITNKSKIKMYFLGGSYGGGFGGLNFSEFIPRGMFETIDVAIVEVNYIDNDGFALSECMSKAARNRLALEKAEYRYLIRSEANYKQHKSYTFKVCSTEKIEHVFEVI